MSAACMLKSGAGTYFRANHGLTASSLGLVCAAPKQVTVVAPTGQLYNLSRYYAEWDQPRPESFAQVRLGAHRCPH